MAATELAVGLRTQEYRDPQWHTELNAGLVEASARLTLNGDLSTVQGKWLGQIGYDTVEEVLKFCTDPESVGAWAALSSEVDPVLANGTLVPRYLADRFADVIHASDMGVVADYVNLANPGTDNRAALQAWIDLLESLDAAGTPKLGVLPGGRIRHSDYLLIKRGIKIIGAGQAATELVLYSPDNPERGTSVWIGDVALDPEPGGNPRPVGQPFRPLFSDLQFTCLNDLWTASEKIGPFDGSLSEHVVEWSSAERERFHVGVIGDGRWIKPNRYTFTGEGTDTYTYTWPAQVATSIYYLRTPRNVYAIENQGSTQATFLRVGFSGFGGWCRDGGKQRNNGSLYERCQSSSFIHRYDGCRVVERGVQDSGPGEEEPDVKPEPAFVATTANEAADGSRTAFTFTLPTPNTATEPLAGERYLMYVLVDGVKIFDGDLEYSDLGTGTPTVTFDTPPSVTPQLVCYTIPMGLPCSFYVMHNSGPAWFLNNVLGGGAADHCGGGAIYEMRPTTGTPPTKATRGGATGDTKIFVGNTGQAFWPPFGSSVAWDEVFAASAPDGVEDTFVFTFSQVVEPGTFRVFNNGVSWTTLGDNSIVVSGYGTNEVTAVLSPAPPAGAASTLVGRRYDTVEPVGKPHVHYNDYTEGHPSNVIDMGGFNDHSTVAALYFRTDPDPDDPNDPDSYRSFTRQMFYGYKRYAVDMGQWLRIEANSSQICAAMTFSNINTWARRDDELVYMEGSYSGISLENVFLGELGNATFWKNRKPLIRIAGEMPKLNIRGGRMAGKTFRALAPAVIEVLNPLVNTAKIDAHFPGGATGYKQLIKYPRYVSEQYSLVTDPIRTAEVDTDGDGEYDAYNPNPRVTITPGWLLEGEQFILAGVEDGNGLNADLFLNKEQTAYRIVQNGQAAVIALASAYVAEGIDNPINAAGTFGGSSVTLTKYREGLITRLVDGTNLISTTDTSDLVTIKTEGVIARKGQVFLVKEVGATVGGIAPADIEGPRPILDVPDADHVVVQAGAAATSNATEAGGTFSGEIWTDPVELPDWIVSGTPSQPRGVDMRRRLRRAAADITGTEVFEVADDGGDVWGVTLDALATWIAAEAGEISVAWDDVTDKPSTFPPEAHNQAISTITGLQTALDAKAPLASPAFTGNPTVPTQTPGTNNTRAASTAYADAAVAAVVAGAPSGLNTLDELAAAIGDDPIFATSVASALANKADLDEVLLQGEHMIFVPASAMTPRTTNGPAAAVTELATNDVMISYLAFDPDTVEAAQFDVALPPSCDQSAGFTMEFLWMHPSTTTNFAVRWTCQARAFGNNDAMDGGFGAGAPVTDTGGTTNNLYITGRTGTITPAGTPAQNDLVKFQVVRTATDGADTLAVDAWLVGVRLFYTVNAGNDE